jgi:hypothetical protein
MRVVLAASMLALVLGCQEAATAPEPTPILARTGALTHSCAVRTERVDYKPIYWSYGGHDSISTDNATWVARIESDDVVDYQPTPGKLVVSSVAEDGKLGESKLVEVPDPKQVVRPSLIAQANGGFALVWAEQVHSLGGATLHFASFDASGQALSAAKSLPGGEPAFVGSLRTARSENGRIAVVWNAQTMSVYDRVRMLVIDDAGNVVMPVQQLAERSSAPPQVVATARGFAVLYESYSAQDGSLDRTPATAQLTLARFDENGAPSQPAGTAVGEPTSSLGGISFAGRAIALIALDDGFLTARQEGSAGREGGPPSYRGSGGYVALRIARLDAQGELIDSALLRAREDSVDEVEPVLIHHGAQVALLWGRGSHIYTCGGCVPDQDIELVLLDPITLTPRSNVATLPAPKVGGLLHKRASVRAGAILTTFEVTFHTSSDPGFAAFACAPSS